MALSKFQHVFDTWVYPRVYHFQRRFLDVHKRFTNVISKGPHSSILKPKRELFDKIFHLKDILEDPIEIYVIGKKDIGRNDLVISSEEPPQTKNTKNVATKKKDDKGIAKEHGLTIAMVHLDIKDTGDSGMKDVLKIVGEFTSEYRKKIAVSDDSVIIVCELSTISSPLDTFRRRVCTDLREHFGLNLSESQIVFPKNEEVVSTVISQVLESRVIDGFSMMRAHLESFVRGLSNFSMENVDIVETDTLVSALQAFLKNGMGFIDILESSKSSGKPFEDLLLSSLVRVIRCTVLDPISLKFDLTQDTCHQVAFEINLDEIMEKKISKNTRYHLKKIEKPSFDLAEAIKKGDTWYKFPSRDFIFIAYPLRDDIKSAVLEFEKALEYLQRNVHVMKKMIFEIDGNNKLSPFEIEDLSKAKVNRQCLEELKKILLQIDGVYGMGRIYGEWEVHVESETAKQSVIDMLTEFNIKTPIRIRRVLTKANPLVGNQVEHGIALQARLENNPGQFKSGTLGMFADNINGDLYALTCGHVVNVADHMDHGVYIVDGTGERKTLGTSSLSRTVITGQEPAPLIDLAAVKVRDEIIPKCTKYMKDDDGMLKNAILSNERTRDLDSMYIFKYGAASDLTQGIVCSVDYAFGYLSGEYVVLIAPPPDIDIVDYAIPGDSGSVNCMHDVQNNRAVKVVSMLSAGGLTFEGLDESFSVSFQLNKGFIKLGHMPAQIQLHVPSEYSGGQMF